MKCWNVLLIVAITVLGLGIALGVFFFRVHASPTTASPKNVLWTLTSLKVNGQVHILVPGVPVTITFHELSHTVNGSSGCNNYQATYQQQNSHIHFQDFISSAVGCLGLKGEQENLYLQVLLHAETLHLSAHTLTITGAAGKDIISFSSSEQ